MMLLKLISCFLFSFQEIYALKRDQGICVAEKVCIYDTGSEAVMNSTTAPEGKNYILATGQGNSCHLYIMSYKIVTPKKQGRGMHAMIIKRSTVLLFDRIYCTNLLMVFNAIT